jgi:identified by metaGeneAnnotator|nr:MAG TPA: hypothetical protein [Caudoviricetes sp.]
METATAQLREELFDTLRRLKDGQIDAATAQAVSKISGNIISTVAIEIQAANVIGSDKISSLNGVPTRELAGGIIHKLKG